MSDIPALSRREREVMDIVHELKEATASQIQERMAKPPSNGAIRSTLRILVKKEHLTAEERGPRYIYSETAPRDRVRKSALKHVLNTFFGGSAHGVMAALVDMEESGLSVQERSRIEAMIESAEEEGR